MEQNFWIVALLLKIIGALFGLTALLFTFLSVLQNEKHEKTQNWFRIKWKKISGSAWLEMPEKIISTVLRAEQQFTNFLLKIFDDVVLGWVLTISMFIIIVGIGFLFGFIFAIAVLIINVISILILGDYINIEAIICKLTGRESIKKQGQLNTIIHLVIIHFIALLGIFIWFEYALKVNLFWSSIGSLISIPYFMFIILGPFNVVYRLGMKWYKKNLLALVGFSIGFSFCFTFLSFLIGNLISGQSQIPRTLQMLVSNVIFDGITLLFTFKLLQWAVRKKSWYRIPIILVFDLLVAAVLACTSLYLGLLFSENELSIKETLYILIGRSASGNGIELGPYFWAMHTTFIPTLLYMLLILFAWVGKSLLIPVKWFFGKGREHKNPLGLTAALFYLVAGIFVIVGYATDGIEKYIDTKKEKTAYFQTLPNKCTTNSILLHNHFQ
ncbi:MAG: hypothetical protein AAF489_05190 [Bacteroidota bacterium]